MIKNISNGKIICKSELIAKNFFQRLTGMTTRRFSDRLDGIVFENCNAIHTFGMKFCLDIIFFDSSNVIVGVFKNITPWKMVSCKIKKCSTLELPKGTIDSKECKIGDIIEFS